MKKRKITQREFESVIANFESRESFRSALYNPALRLLKANFPVRNAPGAATGPGRALSPFRECQTRHYADMVTT
jgi:hypothetical protein